MTKSDAVESGPVRPALDRVRSGSELFRWYWLKSELVTLGRLHGLRVSGGKADLTARIAAALDGLPEPIKSAGLSSAKSGKQLSGQLTLESVIPAGQRSSQALRGFFVAELGPGFHFDGPMREFLLTSAGQTLGDAVEFWHQTRVRPPNEIGAQFELNRFLRSWHSDHPGGTHAEAMVAWKAFRSLPLEARPTGF